MIPAGVADLKGVAGSGGVRVLWAEREVDPQSRRLPWVFGRPYPDFRRLDRLSRLVCLAVEAMGVAFAPDTALVLATTMGCLEADLRFQQSLRSEIKPAVFPYTLPSTCLGELAIRHKLTGPSLCLTTARGDERSGIDEARRILEFGEAGAAVVCMGDAATGMVAAYFRRTDQHVPNAADIWQTS